MRKIGAILCFAVAVASVIFALFAGNSTTGRGGFFLGLAFFRTVQSGTFMGFIGNIFGILLTFIGFAATGLYSLILKDDKKTLFWSGGMCIVCLISMIVSIFSGTFTIGDIFIILPCAMVLVSLFTSKN